jgi:5-methylcytosine-specific restriction endonuclease McrA
MALHHVNGDGADNRLENLVLLCPNCHSQTPNFGVKNWKARGAAVATRTF